jgi:hypothetical protein
MNNAVRVLSTTIALLGAVLLTACGGGGGGGGGGSSSGGGIEGGTHKRLKIINGCATEPVWIQYIESGSSGGGVLGAPNRYKLAALNDFIEYDIPDKGIASLRFWPGYGCDADGNNCAIGASGGPPSLGFSCPSVGCSPPIDSKFEATFACLPPLTGAKCQVNPSAAPNTPLGSLDWWNTSMVDGFTVPIKARVIGYCPAGPQAGGPGGPPGGEMDCSGLHFSDCPTNENLSTDGAYPALNSVDLRLLHPTTATQSGCFSPVGKLTYSQWNAGFTTYAPTDPQARMYACPTPPISSTQCTAGPANRTLYRNNIHSRCQTYTYAYDDGYGLSTCPGQATTTYEVTFYCPL